MIYRLIVILLMLITTLWAAMVSGYIRDSVTGKSIPNANITIKGTDQGTTSNPYGYFEINLVNGAYTLETSVIGFKIDSQEIRIDNNNIELKIDLITAILEFNEIQVRGIFSTRLDHESVDVISSNKIKSMDKISVPDVLRTIPGVAIQFAQPNGRNVNV